MVLYRIKILINMPKMIMPYWLILFPMLNFVSYRMSANFMQDTTTSPELCFGTLSIIELGSCPHFPVERNVVQPYFQGLLVP